VPEHCWVPGVHPPPSPPPLEPEPPSETPLLPWLAPEPEPLPEPDPLPDDDDVASFVPASPPWLFEPELEHPHENPSAAARPASTAMARREMNGLPTSPAHRQEPRLSSAACCAPPAGGRVELCFPAACAAAACSGQ